jgi:hypothetical protein
VLTIIIHPVQSIKLSSFKVNPAVVDFERRRGEEILYVSISGGGYGSPRTFTSWKVRMNSARSQKARSQSGDAIEVAVSDT